MNPKIYTLWLLPTGQAYDKYDTLIKKLAKEYNAPIFMPHITLLGECTDSEEDAIEKTKKLVESEKPFLVRMKGIGFQNFYWRTLFVYAEKSKPLLALHEKAKRIFNIDIPPYMPHLSLLYGMFPQELKDRIICDIGEDQSSGFEVNKVVIKKGGEIKDWKIISEFPLK